MTSLGIAQAESFDEGKRILLLPNLFCTGFATGDLDGDGLQDAFLAMNYRGDYIAFGDGKGGYSNQYLGRYGYRPGQSALADVDGDGDLDILSLNSSYRNDGARKFTPMQAFGGRGLAAGDLDGDGDVDLITCSDRVTTISLNDGKGAFTTLMTLPYGCNEHGVALADIDADGDLDASVGSRVLMNIGLGRFVDSGQALGGTAWLGGRAFADFNQDEVPDLILASGQVYLNDKSGRFTRQANQLPWGMDVAAGDVNGDGKTDVVLAAPVRIYLGNGDGSFESVSQTIPVGVPPFPCVGLKDMDGDGWIDLIHGASPINGNPGDPFVFPNAWPSRIVTVQIDIKPGSYPNSIQLNGNGVIPVAINGSAVFDVLDIDPSTLLLNGAAVKVVGKVEKMLFAYEDWNKDGYLDLMLKFLDDPTKWAPGSAEAVLKGKLKSGKSIVGKDSVRLVPE